MGFKRKKRSESATWIMVAGVVLTGAAAAYAVSRFLKSAPVSRRLDARTLEKRVIQALLDDEGARYAAIDIATVGAGILEIAGEVETQSEARHIVELVDRVAGVHAVINRMEIRSVESRLERNRKKAGGEATRWYGGSVGMGRRRQNPATDPLQRDDHVELLSKSLQPNRDEALSEIGKPQRTGAPPAIAPHEKAQTQ